MEDTAEASLVDELLGEGNRGHAAVVVPDHVRDAGFLYGIDHFAAFRDIHGQRLFAQDHLAGLGRGNGNVVVHIVGRTDVDGVDVIAGDQCAPVRLDAFIAPVVGECLNGVFVARAGCLQYKVVGDVEEFRRLPVGIGVGAAHESAAHQSDVQLFPHGSSPVSHRFPRRLAVVGLSNLAS